ncbi:MAG: glycine cleavage system aminomethyltransferase GcvT [Nitrospinota bacterium]|nr:glycine cleavage system aminomethyltransferase GcvT [Nitrospinota bacterium]
MIEKQSSHKRTHLFDKHVGLGAKIVPFSGFEMPVQYSGIKSEHLTVRENVGIFDASHMGEFIFEGPESTKMLNFLVTNNIAKLPIGQVLYTLICKEDGGILDDVMAYRISENKYMLVVNASNIEKDFDWVSSHNCFDCELENVSEEMCLIALQGPNSEIVLEKLVPQNQNFSKLDSFQLIECEIDNASVLISRTGYTGEDGYEIYCRKNKVHLIWDQLLEFGKTFDIAPCGLGSRDTLRIEMKYSLYGNEIDELTNPYEAGLGWVVKLNHSDFIGHDKLSEIRSEGICRKLVGFEMIDRGIPRKGNKIFLRGKEIGYVTSGTMSPSLNLPIGIGYVSKENALEGGELEVDIRGSNRRGCIVKTPFYRKN